MLARKMDEGGAGTGDARTRSTARRRRGGDYGAGDGLHHADEQSGVEGEVASGDAERAGVLSAVAAHRVSLDLFVYGRGARLAARSQSGAGRAGTLYAILLDRAAATIGRTP